MEKPTGLGEELALMSVDEILALSTERLKDLTEGDLSRLPLKTLDVLYTKCTGWFLRAAEYEESQTAYRILDLVRETFYANPGWVKYTLGEAVVKMKALKSGIEDGSVTSVVDALRLLR